MFGMEGFHISASGAIQGHHVPLVFVFEGIDHKHLTDLAEKYFGSLPGEVYHPQTVPSRFTGSEVSRLYNREIDDF